MASLINRIQRAFLGSAGPEKVRALLAELAIPAGGSGENALREARRGFLRPISDEAILRDALSGLGLTGGGSGARPLSKMRSAILHNLADSETTLRDGLDVLLEPSDLAGGGGAAWLPEGAVAFMDFTTTPVRAFADGQEVADTDTIFGDSSLLGITYDPSDIVAGVGLQGPLAFIGPMQEPFLDDFTLLAEFDNLLNIEMAETTFSTDLVLIHSGSTVRFTDQSVNLKPLGAPVGSAGSHKMAITLTAASAYGAYDGDPLFIAGDDQQGSTMVPTMSVPPTDFISNTGTAAAIKRLTFYSVKSQNDTTALTA